MGLWHLPYGRFHAHFAEREQKPRPGISISTFLGVGSHTKIPVVGFETRLGDLVDAIFWETLRVFFWWDYF